MAAGLGVRADAAADGGLLRQVRIGVPGGQRTPATDLPASGEYPPPYSYGTVYFLRGNSLDALAYPRTAHKKTYCWKKMNFPTLLPKHDPRVKYLVASSFLSGHLHPQHPLLFRMHIVVTVKAQTAFMLCHIRRVG